METREIAWQIVQISRMTFICVTVLVDLLNLLKNGFPLIEKDQHQIYSNSNEDYLNFFTRYDPDAILVGVLLSGLLFGLAHGISKTYIYVAWLLGMYLSLIYLVSGDLMLVMLVHALFDITGFIHALYIHKPEKAKRKELR